MAASFSRDPLFEVVLRQLPEQVAAGLRSAGVGRCSDFGVLSLRFLHGAGWSRGHWCWDVAIQCYWCYGYDGRWWYGRWRPFIIIAALPISPFFPIFSRLPSSSLSSALSPCFRHAQIEKCYYQVIDSLIRGNALRALETEPERESFTGGGRGKIRRITKGRSGIKSRKVAGMPNWGHMVSELRGSRAGTVEGHARTRLPVEWN